MWAYLYVYALATRTRACMHACIHTTYMCKCTRISSYADTLVAKHTCAPRHWTLKLRKPTAALTPDFRTRSPSPEAGARQGTVESRDNNQVRGFQNRARTML